MKEQQPNSNFLDTRTLIAIIMVGLIWVFWQSHLEKKYPDAYKPPQPAVQTVTTTSTEANTQSAVASQVNANPSAVSRALEKVTPFEDAQWQFGISSHGMGFHDVVLKNYSDRENRPFALGATGLPMFQTVLKGVDTPLEFEVTQNGADEFRGVAHYQGAEIVKTVHIHSDSYSFETEVQVSGAAANFPGLVTTFSDPIHPTTSSGFFSPATEKNEIYVAHGTSEDRVTLKADESLSKTYNDVSLIGLGSHFFVSAILDQSDNIPSVTITSRPEAQLAAAALTYTPLNGAPSMKLSYRVYAGPKSMTLLHSIDPRLVRVINFGMFSWIARPLLDLMKLIYSLVGNWGAAIIVLTLLVRMVVLPINIFSFRSMKSMQAIQPQMKALREKYKDDPKTLNVEMMALMKHHRVNPLGGCLPMLLQLPVFLALYAVLGQSIELYKAPFMLWIQDLSLKDPYYVLPVMMGLSMFVQQRLTPSTMDPAQAKVMMFMPLVFSLMMFGLPSGLTLYIFISTLFGIIQQFIFMRDRNALAGAPQQVKA